MTPPETSLATIQSQPLRARLAMACSTTFWVSAAKPMTRRGRCGPAATVARMSGLSAMVSVGAAAPGCFFSFCVASCATRQSATAAAMTAMSAGSAASQAVSMSRADSTWTVVTPGGSGSVTGPATSVTRAPSAASAAAMEWPCLPLLRFAM